MGLGRLPRSDLSLPFEGDLMLSTILSKALLLASDRSITDVGITRQIAGAVPQPADAV